MCVFIYLHIYHGVYMCVCLCLCVYAHRLDMCMYMFTYMTLSLYVCVYIFTCLYTAFPCVYVCPKNLVDTCPLHEAKRVGVVYIGW